MTPVEILNTLGERNDPSFRPFINPDEYDETRFIRINGKFSRVDRGDYLTAFIMALFIPSNHDEGNYQNRILTWKIGRYSIYSWNSQANQNASYKNI